MKKCIMTEWLTQLNKTLQRQKRNILLFMDNAKCHLTDNIYSNAKVVFLPPNATALSQPLDCGIIQALKLHSRKMLMRKLVSKITNATSVSALTKEINVLDAIN